MRQPYWSWNIPAADVPMVACAQSLMGSDWAQATALADMIALKLTSEEDRC